MELIDGKKIADDIKKEIAIEVEKMVAEGSKRTFNSVNATLAAMAGKGYVDKSKGLYNEKLLTCYTLTEAGIAELDKEEGEDAEASA